MPTGWLKQALDDAARAAAKLPQWALDLDAAIERGSVRPATATAPRARRRVRQKVHA